MSAKKRSAKRAAAAELRRRVVAGGLEDVDPGAVQIWLRKDGAPVNAALYARAKGESGSVILVRMVTFDLANARRYRALEIDIELSPDLPGGVYDVEVAAGDAIAVEGHEAGSTMGLRWAGPHGGLVVERAVKAISIEADDPTIPGDDYSLLYYGLLSKDMPKLRLNGSIDE